MRCGFGKRCCCEYGYLIFGDLNICLLSVTKIACPACSASHELHVVLSACDRLLI